MLSEYMTFDVQSDAVYSIEHHHLQKRILAFLQTNIPQSVGELVGAAKSNLSKMYEDKLSGELVNLLNDRLRESSPYLFRFEAKSGPDILIFASPYQAFSSELFVIEAKRLPPTKPRDYVRMGIGRFKREEHGKEHDIAAMLGYIQDEDFGHWYKKVNSWIEDLISTSGENPRWIEQDKLRSIRLTDVGEYRSTHSRINENPITLYHFWVPLFNISEVTSTN